MTQHIGVERLELGMYQHRSTLADSRITHQVAKLPQDVPRRAIKFECAPPNDDKHQVSNKYGVQRSSLLLKGRRCEVILFHPMCAQVRDRSEMMG